MSAADFVKALQGTEEIELTDTGRVSGNKSTPGLVRPGGQDALSPARAGIGQRGVQERPEAPHGHPPAEEAKWTGKAAPIMDPARVHDVVESFRTKSERSFAGS
jgi:hypothetical protein